jgi:hypothetical protein
MGTDNSNQSFTNTYITIDLLAELTIDSEGTKLHEGALDEQGRTPGFPMEKEIVGTFG